MQKLSIWISILLISAFALGAQQAQGLDPLPEGLNQSMAQAQPRGVITSEAAIPGDGIETRSLPPRVDLSSYLPPVGSQGNIGSCSAWSTVYYAKTIQENQERQWGADTPDHQYSPLFTYNQITGGVNQGTAITDHMIILEKQGVPPLSAFPHTENINIQPGKAVMKEAEQYRSLSHRNLDQYNAKTGTWSVDLTAVKTALAEGFPVVGGFQIYENFYDYRGGIYNRTAGAPSGGHAMCIVGYDDARGALRIVNSWGTWWGEEGFLWLAYDLFEPLCTYNCALMYDKIDSVPELVQAPPDLRVSKGGYRDRIELKWEGVDGADFYLVYKVNNEEGVLKEISRTTEPAYTDESLPPGVSYIYAVKSGKSKKTGNLISEFSEIGEGWTAEVRSPPGIPSNLTYTLYKENPLLIWDPVEEAEGYNIYRWDAEKEEYSGIGRSGDSTYLDRSFGEIPGGGIIYYIVEAYNDYGSGYATDNLSVLKELPESGDDSSPVVIVSVDTRDDVAAYGNRQNSFSGEFHRTDYFDYEYTMARFREFYEKEQEAFRNFKQDERNSFEEWKKRNESPSRFGN